MQKEIFMQAIANFSMLIIPYTLVCNGRARLNYFDFLCFGLWFNSIAYETIADIEKLNFVKRMAKEGKRN